MGYAHFFYATGEAGLDLVGQVLEVSGILFLLFFLCLVFQAAEIEPAPSFGVKIRADFINGMGKVRDKFVIILDAVKVLSVNEMAMLSEVSASTDITATLTNPD